MNCKLSTLCMVFLLLGIPALRAQQLLPWADKNSCLFGYKYEGGGDWVIAPRYNYATNFIVADVAVVGIGDKYGLIGKDGKLRGEMRYNTIVQVPVNEYNRYGAPGKAYLAFYDGKQYGLLNLDGTVALPARFSYIKWKQGNIIGTGNGFADTSGKVLGNDMELYSFSEGRSFFTTYKTLLHKDDGYAAGERRPNNMVYGLCKVWGLVDSSGKVLLEPVYTEIERNYLPLVILTAANGKKGVCTYKGELKIPAVYDDIQDYFHGKPLLRLEGKGLFYLYDYKENKILFDGTSVLPSAYFTNVFIPIYQNNKYGLGNLNGKVILKPEYDSLNYAYNNGSFVVKKGSQYGVIDTAGRNIVPVKYSSISNINEQKPGTTYDPGRLLCYRVTKNKHFGIVNLDGKECLPPSYEYLEYDGYSADSIMFIGIKGNKASQLMVYKDTYKINPFGKDKSYTIIGNKIISDNELAAYYNGLSVYNKGSEVVWHNPNRQNSYLINNKGEVLLKLDKYAIGGFYSGDTLAIYGPKGMGFMNTKGKMIVQPVYKRIVSINDYTRLIYYNSLSSDFRINGKGFYYCETQDGKLGVMDKHFKIVLPAIYSAISDYRGCWFVQEQDKPWAMLSPDGTQVLMAAMDGIPLDFGGLFTIGQQNKYGLMDRNGKMVVPCNYQSININPYHRFLVIKDNKYGLLDAKGNVLLPCEYDYMGNYINNYCQLRRNGKTGIIDSTGHWVAEPLYGSIANAKVALETLYELHPVVGATQYYATHICRNIPKTKDSLPGITTTQYFHNNGYYELLSTYPLDKDRIRINNYIVNSFLNPNGYWRPMNNIDEHYEIPVVENLHALADHRMPWGEGHGHDWDEQCSQTDYSIVCFSKNIVGIKATVSNTKPFGSGEDEYAHKTRIKPVAGKGNQTQAGLNDGTDISYQYLWLGADTLVLVTADMVFSSNGWMDILARRIQAIYDNNRPEARFCSNKEQEIAQQKQEYEQIRASINPSAFVVKKQGLSWAYHYQNQIYHVYISFQELQPFLKWNNPLKEIMR